MNYRVLMFVASLALLGGCATTGAPSDSWQQAVARPSFADVEAAPAEEAMADEPPAPADSAESDAGAQRSPGTGTFINQSVAAKMPPPAGAAGEVTFNFEGESLHAVVKTILGEILQQNYVIAPGVQGTVTFSTAKPLRGDQALSILEMLLRWNNATLVWQDGRYTILPIAQAVQGNLTPRTGPVAESRGYEVRAVPLKFISALEMEKVLKPYAKPEAVLNVDPARNMIVLAGTRAELENYLQTVDVFDVDWLAGMSVGMFTLHQAEAAKVIAELEKVFGEGSNTPLAGMFRFIALEGVNGVLVITPQPKYLDSIKEWIDRLDLGSGEAGARLYVYEVKNVKAIDLADTLSNVFGSGGGGLGRSSGDVAPGLQSSRISTMSNRAGGFNSSPMGGGGFNGFNQKSAQEKSGAEGDPAQPQAAVSGMPATAPAGAGTSGPEGNLNTSMAMGDNEDVRISAVEDSNSLLVRATAAQWESIRRVIERLDVVPLQVAIEAQIISVSLTDQLDHGVQWYFENAISDAATRTLAAGRNSFSDISGSIAGGSTAWSFVGRNVNALVELVDKVAETKVLSAPSLVVLNNRPAVINSGRQVPITTTSINLGVGGTTQPIATTQYLQTGITLSVTPRVNPGGLVFLEIEQEDSSAEANTSSSSTSGAANPAINQARISTEIAIQSGETVLLGGLIKQNNTKGTAGLPGLSRLPVVGGLFGKHSNFSDRQELLVLITPKVISGVDEARTVTEDYKRQFRALQPLRGAAQP